MSTSPFTTSARSSRSHMLGLDNAQKPQIVRKRWTNEEEVQLLTLLKKKKPVEEIAAMHGRTVTAINLKRQSLAAEYHFNESRSNQDIQKLTGLTAVEVEKAIAKHSVTMQVPAPAPAPATILDRMVPLPPSPPDQQNYVAIAQESQSGQSEPTMKEMMALLLNMQKTVKTLVPDEPEPTMRDLMKVVNDIQKRLDTLIAPVR